MAEQYFSDLNYTLSNEDTRIEFELLKDNADAVFSIAGSGARCLPLTAKNPKELHIVDMSEAQNFLCELRFQAAKVLTYSEWLFFLGYRGAIPDGTLKENHRLELFEKLSLQPKTKQYWLQRQNGWVMRGFILLGRWESHFQKLGMIFRDVLKCDFSLVFEAQTLQEQIEIYENTWPQFRWKSFMKIAASEYVFNKFLYKGHFSGGAHHRTEKRAPSDFLIEEFDRIFRTQLVRKNYFMQILFLGKIRYEEGLPFEAWESTFQKVKESKTVVHYHVGNLLDVLPKRAWDFISLSDTISYLPNDRAENILQDLVPETKAGSRMVIRSFLRVPQDVQTKGWKHLSDKDQWAFHEDGTGVYQFHIYEKS